MKTLQRFLLFTLCIITLRLHSAQGRSISLSSQSSVSDTITSNRYETICTERLSFPLPSIGCFCFGFLAGAHAMREGSPHIAAGYVTAGFIGMYSFATKETRTSRGPISSYDDR